MSSIDPFDEPRGDPPPPNALDVRTEALPTVPSDFTYCPDHDACYLAFMQLLPTGAAWDNVELSYEKSSIIRQFMSGIAKSWLHFEDAMCVSLDEWICSTSDEDIDAWAKDYGVPDECELYNQNLCAKVSANGPATADYLIGLLEASGYEAVGRWLNGQDPQYPGVYSTFHVLIDSTISPAYQLQPSLPFPLGSGHRLGDVDISNLTCMLERYIPAHCVAVVGIAGEFEPEDLGAKLVYWWAAADTSDGAVTNWIDRIATLSTSTAGGREPISTTVSGKRVVGFNQHIGHYLRTASVNVPGPSSGPTQYVAMWSQPELPPLPGDWLIGEVNGFAVEFTSPQLAKVAVKTAGAVTEWEHDKFFTVISSPKYIYTNGGILTYTPHNYFTKTEEFDQAIWTKTACTITVNATTAPNGTLTADKLVETVAGGAHEIRHALTAMNGNVSVYAKAGERPCLMIYSAAEIKGDGFDLLTGTVFVAAGITPTGGAAIEDVGDGWYRCSIPITAATSIRFYAHNGTTHSYVGDGTSGIYLWGAQATHSGGPVGVSEPSDYLPNPGTAQRTGVSIDHDPTTLAPRGMLSELPATNLLWPSSRFENAAWSQNRLTVVADATTGPNGRVEADKLVEGTETNSHLLGRTTQVTITAVQYTLSVFAKAAERNWLFLWDALATNSGAWFNLTTGTVGTVQSAVDRTKITALPNGWYRCEIEYTGVGTTAAPYFGVCQADGVTSYTGDGVSGLYIWGAQMETGSLATSPIYTVTAATARSADQVYFQTSQIPFSDVEHTIHAEYRLRHTPTTTAAYVAEIYLSAANRAAFHHGAGGLAWMAASNPTIDVNVGFGTAVLPGVLQKVTVGFKTNEAAATNNGSALVTDTVNTLSTGLTRFNLGHYGAGTHQMNGWIERVVHVPRRVLNADLQTWRNGFTGGNVHAVVSRGSASNYRRFGTRNFGGLQAVNVASDATHDLVDTNTGTILSGPIVGAAGYESDGLKARVFGMWTTPPALAAPGTTAQTNSPITIGANTATVPGEFLQGNIYHLFVCTDLTPSEMLQLEGWAAWDINRPDVLDGSHPYRNIRP